jgi:hypothetical protein
MAPVLALLVLAPWVGEYLLGNIPLSALVALPFLLPLYGGGALLIREVTRRTGRGWPTILLLGAAYGVIEAGLVDQSLFNPSYDNVEQGTAVVPALGLSLHNAVSFVAGHAIWSIGIPLAIVELLTPSRRTTPWLGRTGLVVAAVLYAFGCWIIYADHVSVYGFAASPAQRLGAATAALALIATAFAVGRRTPPPLVTRLRLPRPWVLGVGTFVASSAFFARPENWLGGVVLSVAGLATAATVVVMWSRQPGWDVRHQFALVAGALPTYAWGGFVLTYLFWPDDAVAWAGNVLFAVVAVALLVVTGVRLRER